MEVMALIPARSGSKGIPHKNISTFRGKPLLAHSIEQALKSHFIKRVVVSTDSNLYANIALEYGAETPFLRPIEISGDLSTDLELFQHALAWLENNESYKPDICVHLRPTYPNREVDDIDHAIESLISDPYCDSVRSVVIASQTPYKMWFMDENKWLSPVLSDNFGENYNSPRQTLPEIYIQNAAIDVVWSKVILEQNSMTGKKIHGFIMNDFLDIDNRNEFGKTQLSHFGAIDGKKFVIDIDGIISTLTPNNDYSKALPILRNIRIINALFDNGNTIILFTARGTDTGIDWTDVTHKQMDEWGVKYDVLKFGKPAGDYYIDDRSIDLYDLENALEKLSDKETDHKEEY